MDDSIRIGCYGLIDMYNRLNAIIPKHIAELVVDARPFPSSAGDVLVSNCSSVGGLGLVSAIIPEVVVSNKKKSGTCRQCLLSLKTINVLSGQKHSGKYGCPFAVEVILELRALCASDRAVCEASFLEYASRSKIN